MSEAATIEPTAKWWGKRRSRYNVALLISGLGAFIAYAIIVWAFEHRLNQVEITLFTLLFQAVGYAFAMAVANLCYYLGPLSERLIRPNNVGFYRKVMFGLGLWFSVFLPFLLPALLLYDAVVGV